MFSEKVTSFVKYMHNKKLEQATCLLLDKHSTTENIQKIQEIAFSDEILLAHKKYFDQRNETKQKIVLKNDSETIKALVYQLIYIEKQYAKKWFCKTLDFSKAIISVLPDEMEILKAIKSYRVSNGIYFEDLKNLKNNPPDILLKEMKRLSLLFNNY